MLELIKQNMVLFIVVALGLAGAVWYGISGGSSEELLSTQEVSGASDADIVSTLLALRAVSLDGTIFADPGFETLQDFGSQITAEPYGRSNPFLPLSAILTATSTVTATTSPVQNKPSMRAR